MCNEHNEKRIYNTHTSLIFETRMCNERICEYVSFSHVMQHSFTLLIETCVVFRSIRRLTNATSNIAASAAPIPSVMQAPLLGDLLLTIETLEHHITQNHTVRAEHLQLQKAHALLHKHIGRCTKALELVARRETKGVSEDLAQVSST